MPAAAFTAAWSSVVLETMSDIRGTSLFLLSVSLQELHEVGAGQCHRRLDVFDAKVIAALDTKRNLSAHIVVVARRFPPAHLFAAQVLYEVILFVFANDGGILRRAYEGELPVSLHVSIGDILDVLADLACNFSFDPIRCCRHIDRTAFRQLGSMLRIVGCGRQTLT